MEFIRLCMISLVKLIVKVEFPSRILIKKQNGFFVSGERDPKHRAEEIIRICDVTGNKKLTKEEVSETHPSFN